MFTWLLDVLFPPVCLNCRQSVKSGESICISCFSNIKIFNTLFCGKCRARLPSIALAPGLRSQSGSFGGVGKESLVTIKKICHKDFPYLLGAAADYQDETVKQLVRSLKFGFIKSAAGSLASLLVSYAEGVNYRITAFTVIPIPLSRARERKRGFNQSFLIAKIFAGHFGLELNPNILVRDKNTMAQSEIKDFEKKRDNVKNCFSIKSLDSVNGKNFILIDDVVTSGATFFEAASALKRAGAKKIIALAAAKS
ncbi:MAG: ComF family protein [Candidatus Liptonbacteria bacterium]|nr:ComF family protein [Candidatus Liptonbacteria bacterium]